MAELRGAGKPVLPPQWVEAQIGEIFSVVGGGTPDTSRPELWDGTIPWVTSADIDANGRVTSRRGISEAALRVSAANRVPAGSVVVATRVGLGKAGLATTDLSFSQDCQALVFRSDLLDPKFVAFQMRSVVGLFKHVGRGTTISGVTKKQLLELEFLLAPFPEQHRIVAEIEKQFTRLDAAVASLGRVQAKLKRYRASVLKAACEGRLVPTEAELARAEGRDYESGNRLIDRVRGEGEKLGSQRRPRSGQGARDISNLPEIPEGWTWASPQTLAEPRENAICAGPFGTIFKARDFRPEGVPIIFLRHIRAGSFRTDKPGFMDPQKWSELFVPYSVFGGELLVTKLGEPPGECAIYPDDAGPAMVTPDVIKMSADTRLIDRRYLMHYLNSQTARGFAMDAAFGTTRLRMTLPIFRSLPVPLPPMAEQRRVAAEIERRLSVVDALEAMMELSTKRVKSLRRAVLRKAFEGGLVPQNPADEPAIDLLKRIRISRAVRAEVKQARQFLGKRQGSAVRAS